MNTRILSHEERYAKQRLAFRFGKTGRRIRNAKRARFLRKRGCDVRAQHDGTWLWYPGSDVRSVFCCPLCKGSRYKTESLWVEASHGSGRYRDHHYCQTPDCSWWFVNGSSGIRDTVTNLRHEAVECVSYAVNKVA